VSDVGRNAGQHANKDALTDATEFKAGARQQVAFAAPQRAERRSVCVALRRAACMPCRSEDTDIDCGRRRQTVQYSLVNC